MTSADGMAEDSEDFLRRWSRRKAESRQPEGESASVESPGEAAGVAAGAEAVVPQLPPLESLRGIASEYREFLRPGVDESTRRAALKKLFDDPHFNTMDGLDVYIGDYTRDDPIPEQMLRGLNQARGLIFDAEKPDKKGSERTTEGKVENSTGLSDPEAPLQKPDDTEELPDAETSRDEPASR